VELQDAYADIRAEGAELLAISTDPPDDIQLMIDHANSEFPVLSDSAQAVSRAYSIFNLLEDNLAAPTTLIIDSNNIVIGGHIGQNINDRVPASAILEFLRNPPTD
jgi:peroxiredoxin